MKKTTFLLLSVLLGTAFVSAATGWYNDFLTIKVNGVQTPNNYYLSDSDPASGAAALQGTNFGTVNSLEITGCDMKYWSDTQDRTGGAFYYMIKNADGSVLITSPVEVIWDQTAIGGNDYQGTKTTSINITNLILANGTYQLHVWAKSWGTNQGDSWLSNNSNNYVATFTVSRPVIVTGATGIADNTSYETLKAAFDAINAQPDQSGKDIEIQIAGNTTETASAVLSQPTTASWNSLTIYPTATATISGSFVGAIIDLNGADNVTINGKLNKTGAAKSLTISHTSNADNTNRTIRLVNDAKSNTIQYCTITGKCPSNGAGVVFFSTTTGTDGNDNNIIEFCDINAMGEAAVGIGSAGTTDKSNSGNIIRNNNIYDFYLGNISTNATYGINIGSNNTDWTITGNSLYQTSARTYAAAASATSQIILYVNSGNNNLISDNYIGGSAPNAGGAPYSINAGALQRIVGLYTNVGTNTASSIQNNIIANFDISTAFVTGGSSAFIGYWHNAGAVNVGTVTGNTIGSTSTTGSIKILFTGAALAPLVVGYNIVTGLDVAMNYSNNKCGGILIDLNNTTNRAHFYGVSVSGAGSVSFTNGVIGSETVANSIELKGTTNTGSQTNVRGLSFGPAVGATISGNLIANITCSSTGHYTTNGIYINGNNINSINNNIIRDLKSYATRTNSGTTAAMVGILNNCNSAGNSISNNTIYNLSNLTTTADQVEAYGILFESINAGVTTIENNKIYNINSASSNTNSNIIGIFINNGLTTTKNNMISLGRGLTTAYNISGIRKSNTKNNNFYHNSVLISGAEVGAAGTTSTAAFLKTGSGTDILKNNILMNTRSNAAGNIQKHYAISIDGTTTFTSNYNLLYVNGIGGSIGLNATTVCDDLTAWKTSVSPQDANSKSGNVSFVNSSAGDLRIAPASYQDANLQVVRLAEVLTDFSGANRDYYTYAGAHQAERFIINSNYKLSENGIRLMNTSSGIEVLLNNESSIELYNVNGILIDKTRTSGVYKKSLNKGIYIININGEVTKFVK